MIKFRVKKLEDNIKAVILKNQPAPEIITYTCTNYLGSEKIISFDDNLTFDTIGDFEKHYNVANNHVILIEVCGDPEISENYGNLIVNR